MRVYMYMSGCQIGPDRKYHKYNFPRAGTLSCCPQACCPSSPYPSGTVPPKSASESVWPEIRTRRN